MLTFVFLDYKSAGATVACISHYIQKCKNSSEELSFVVVDNSVDDENFEKLSMSWKTVTACEYEGSIQRAPAELTQGSIKKCIPKFNFEPDGT